MSHSHSRRNGDDKKLARLELAREADGAGLLRQILFNLANAAIAEAILMVLGYFVRSCLTWPSLPLLKRS